MSTVYTIKLVNKRGQDTNYGIFQDVPEFSTKGDSWMNVWFAQFLPFNANTNIQATVENYACQYKLLSTFLPIFDLCCTTILCLHN